MDANIYALFFFFFFQAEDGIRDLTVTGVQTCALPISNGKPVETVVRSPIDGYILEDSIEIGDPVVPLTPYQAGTVLMRLAAMRDLIFRGTVDEIDVGRLKEGMPATIKIGALPTASVKGRLEKIWLKAHKQEQATVFPIEIVLTEVSGATLRAGYSANAEVAISLRGRARLH